MMQLYPLQQSPAAQWDTMDSMLHRHLWWTLQWKGSSTILAETTSRDNSNLPMQRSTMCMQWVPTTFEPRINALVKMLWIQLSYPWGRKQTIWTITKILLTTKLETTTCSNRTWIPFESWSKNTQSTNQGYGWLRSNRKFYESKIPTGIGNLRDWETRSVTNHRSKWWEFGILH